MMRYSKADLSVEMEGHTVGMLRGCSLPYPLSIALVFLVGSKG